jgi:hypothetical protein
VFGISQYRSYALIDSLIPEVVMAEFEESRIVSYNEGWFWNLKLMQFFVHYGSVHFYFVNLGH